MFKTNIYLCNRNSFYELKKEDDQVITGYEAFFLIIQNFKDKFGYTIHSLGENNDVLHVTFKQVDITIRLERTGERYYLVLETHKNSIEDFTTKYNYLKELVGE